VRHTKSHVPRQTPRTRNTNLHTPTRNTNLHTPTRNKNLHTPTDRGNTGDHRRARNHRAAYADSGQPTAAANGLQLRQAGANSRNATATANATRKDNSPASASRDTRRSHTHMQSDIERIQRKDCHFQRRYSTRGCVRTDAHCCRRSFTEFGTSYSVAMVINSKLGKDGCPQASVQAVQYRRCPACT
jgi:hypothetical protein